MFSRLSKCLAMGLALFLAFALAACSGGNSGGDDGGGERVAQTFKEGCTLCHAPGSIVDVEEVHSSTDRLRVVIADVRIVGSNQPEVDFTVINADTGVGVAGLTGFSFTIAKLVPGASADSNWQSYINALQDVENPPSGWPPAADAPNTTGTATQATLESNGTLIDAGLTGGRFGDYTYTFATDLAMATDPNTGALIGYDPSLTHRLAIETPRGLDFDSDSATFDFVPAGGAVTTTRNIAVSASCNECHVRLALHGEHRINVEYCVTCHNPGSSDPHSGNTLDLKVMVHKIHRGEDLPEVEAGGEYAIWGFFNSKQDYSTVVYPQDIRSPHPQNCTKCHDGADAATPDGDNWKDVPSTAACTSCHDAPDPAEYPTFPNLTAAEIETAHQIPAQVAAANFEYSLISVTDPDGGKVDPGDFVKVTFSVFDPAVGDIPAGRYDISAHPAFTSTIGGASRLAILIGWDSTDYTNTDSESDPAQPISLDPLFGGATDNGDGTFSVISSVAIPTTVTGSGVAAIDGHPAGDFDADGTYSDRVPVKNVFQNFAITDATAQNRRTVVDIANCKSCHGVLSLHGNNRTDEPQICVICHNANATDIDVRPGGGAIGIDGKVEEAIDFKYMIHAIHAGDEDEHGFRENGIVIYGFRGSINDFSEVRLPTGNENLRNCTGCHLNGTFEVPIDEDALPTTILMEANLASPDDDKNITPNSSVCSSCHDSIFAKTHMTEEGGRFDFVEFAPAEPGEGSETDLCGPGPIDAQPPGHSDSLSCCSCHSTQ